MIDPAIFIGEPIEFGTICKVYPLKVKEVLTNKQVPQLFKMLTYSQEDIEDLFSDLEKKDARSRNTNKRLPTPLEFILINSYQNRQFLDLVQQAFLLFIHEPVTLIYETKNILIGEMIDLAKETNLQNFRLLDENNFFDFQNCVRQSFGENPIELPNLNEDPMVRRIKAASRRRERLAAKSHSKKGVSLTTTLGAICCMGIGLTPLNIGEISYASVDVITTLYQQKERYQIDIDSLMAGADPKKIHPKYWIREKSDFNEIKI